MLLSLPHHMYDMYCNVYHCVSESYSYSLSSSHLSSSDYHSTSPACYRYSSCSYDCSSSSFCIVIVRHLLMLVVSMSACASFNCFTLVFTLFHCYSCVVVCVCVCHSLYLFMLRSDSQAEPATGIQTCPRRAG